jgi:hypothetical protein
VFFLFTTTLPVSSSLDLRAMILVYHPFIFSKSGSEPAIFVRICRSFCASCHVSPNLSFSLCLGLPTRSQSSLVCGSLSIHGRAPCSTHRFALHGKSDMFPHSTHEFFVIGSSSGFAWSALVLSAGLPWCETQATPVSSGRLNRF